MDPEFHSIVPAVPHRATRWRLRTRTLVIGRRPLLMGIVNVTPDSFSDGGKFLNVEAAVDHAVKMIDDGADIIDLGGESTRPYSTATSVEEELDRIAPVVERLAGLSTAPISIDTRKAAVARTAIELGAEIVNDVSGLTGDSEMLPLAAATGVGICAMHMHGTPQTMQDAPRYDNVVADIYNYLLGRRDALLAAGIQVEKICLDPGIGFGKTHQHNLTLMAASGRFLDLGCPVLIGHSRKGFLGKIAGTSEARRDAATVGAGIAAAAQGVHVLRVHNVRMMRDALAAWEACTSGVFPDLST